MATEVSVASRRPPSSGACADGKIRAPPAGFEPAHTAPEADALSPELWGLRDAGKATSRRAHPDTQPRNRPRRQPRTKAPARTGRKQVPRAATLTRGTHRTGRVLV